MINMKKFIYIAIILCGCSSQPTQPLQPQSTIENICQEVNSTALTSEEIAHWDSLIADGECLLVRGAERNLDTIVNHLHLIFITEQ